MKNKLELFGTTGTSGLYGGVKYARLIGQGVHANECINSIAGREIFDDADKYNDINSTQGEIPAFVSGAIPENIRLDATDALAVTINNHIAGVVSAASVGGGSKRFQLMVDEQYFIQGKNDLGLFSIASKCN